MYSHDEPTGEPGRAGVGEVEPEHVAAPKPVGPEHAVGRHLVVGVMRERPGRVHSEGGNDGTIGGRSRVRVEDGEEVRGGISAFGVARPDEEVTATGVCCRVRRSGAWGVRGRSAASNGEGDH